MSEYAISVDVTTSTELKRVAEQVRRTRQPVPLTQGGEVIAVVQPVPKGSRKQRPAKRAAPSNAWLTNLIGLGASDGPGDVSENVDHYLAQAYYEEFHPPAKR
ncbi:MAG TPA: hypothetical protein VII06_04605 [Chloroflexota bacterium]|jgi:hypothetical protein